MEMFTRADRMSDRGQLRDAFRLFLAAARAGDKASQLNVGCFYDEGKGVRRNRSAALYWYKRAYRHGDASAAHNIGTIWRGENNPQRALSWFRRAVKLGSDDSNLEIAKHYLQNGRDLNRAILYLNKVCHSNRVTEASAEEAMRLLQETKRILKESNPGRRGGRGNRGRDKIDNWKRRLKDLKDQHKRDCTDKCS
jgi:TPR repeat protein